MKKIISAFKLSCGLIIIWKHFGAIAIFFFLNFYPDFIKAQNGGFSKINKNEIIFGSNHISFSFSLFSTSKARIKPLKGNYPISSSAMPGINAGLIYHLNFNKQYSLNTGVEATIAGRNFNVNFYARDFSPALKKDYLLKGINTFVGDLILCVPLSLERKLFYKPQKFLFGKAGIRLNYSAGADFDTDAVAVENTDGNFFYVAEIDKYANNDAKPWISYLLSAGHGWILKNNNISQVSIVCNLSFTKYVNGSYKITIPGKPVSEGYYSSTGTYIGISYNYSFTNANYRIRRKYEQNAFN